MEKLQIPQGEWAFEEGNDNHYRQRIISIENDTNSGFITIYTGADRASDEHIDLAKLICDTGNTYNECETLPSELLRQNKEMKEALESIKIWFERGYELSGKPDEYYKISDCLTSLNKDKE